MREIRTSGSMSGMWKRSMVRIMRHRRTKGPETDRPDLTHRATSRLYPDPVHSVPQSGILSGLPVIRPEPNLISEFPAFGV